jgi:glucose-6-phosphate isomerase
MFALRRTDLLMVVGLCLALCAGCGPIQSTAFIIDAETMLEAASTAQAQKHAPYEWTAASLYYSKAKEEVGYSDFEQAVDYAKKAVEFATKARDNALKASRHAEPTTPPLVAP